MPIFGSIDPMTGFAEEAERKARQQRMIRAFGLVLLTFIFGTLGFYQLTDGAYRLLDCLYATVLTVSTVGFREVIPVRESDALTIYTILLIMFGGGALLYFLSSITAVVIEGDLQFAFWRRRMQAAVNELDNHVVVAGAGRTGMFAARELHGAGTKMVIVDNKYERIETLLTEFGEDMPHVPGDALDEATLLAAGIERARGIIASLPDDRDNLFLCLTARQLNPKLRIIAKVYNTQGVEKFRRVGVDAVVSPALMGGRRMASEMVQPEVVSFLGALLASNQASLALNELRIEPDSPVAGQTLRSANLRSHTNCLVLALKHDNEDYIYNPGPDAVLEANTGLLALGEPKELNELRSLLSPIR